MTLDHDAVRAAIDYLLELGDVDHLGHAVHDLLEDHAALRAKVQRLTELIADLASDEDCWFDHHGGCQEHGYLSLESGQKCPHQEAKEVLAENGAIR